VKIFLSHPSEERDVAERMNLALVQLGHDVFFDRADLEAGREYDQAIADAIAASELFIFLITPGSVKPGRYTLTELEFAEERWPSPDGRVLPVMLRPTDFAAIPNYLRAVNILTPAGDPVAETAHAVRKLTSGRSLTNRVARRLRSPLSLAVAAAIVALGAWSWTRLSNRGSPRANVVRLPDAIRQRARAVLPLADSGFVVALANPHQLARFSDDGVPIGEPVDLMGDPVSMTRTPQHVIVVTRGRDGLMVFDAKKLRAADSTVLDPSLVRPAPGISNPPRRSGDLQSAAVGSRGSIWVTTGDRDGEPTVLRYTPADATWDVPTFTIDSAGFGPEANGVRLRDVYGEMWGVRTRGEPSALYHLVGFIRVDRFDGKDMKLVRCAHDLGDTPARHVLFLSCENELQEVEADAKQLTVVRTRPTVPPDRAPGTTSYDLIATDSTWTVVVALSTVARNDTPVRARMVEVDSVGAVRTLLDERNVVVRSLATTARSVIAVLRRADGSADAVVIPRLSR